MPELGSLIEREMQEICPTEYSIADVARRRDRRRRNRRIGSAVVAIAVAAGVAVGLGLALGPGRARPAITPPPVGVPLLRHGDELVLADPGYGIIALNPATLHTRLLLDTSGSPICDDRCYSAWSADGRWLAWVRSDGGPPPCPQNGLWVMRAGAPPLHLSGSVGGVLWAPQGPCWPAFRVRRTVRPP